MKILKKILAGIFKVLSWLILFATVMTFVLLLIFPAVGLKPYIVQSGSMEPIIHTGSVVYINEHSKDIAINDIVAYRLTNDVFVTHRVVDIKNNTFITKGDANEAIDLAPVPKDNIIGKFVFTIPWIGYVITKLKSNIWLALPIMSGLLLILIIDNLFDHERLKQSKKIKMKTE